MLEVVRNIVSHATSGDWLLLAAGFLLFFYIVGTWNFDYFQRRGIPSTKPKFPFWGDFVPLLFGQYSLHEVVHDLYKRGAGHGVFGSFEITNPVLLIREPDLLKVVCVKEFDNFMNHRSTGNGKIDPIFGKNLANLNDQTWKDMRGTLSPAFTTSKIKVMLPLMTQCAQQFTAYLRDKYDSSEEGSTQQPLVLDMKEIFSRLTNDIIATTAFGVSCDSLRHPDNEFYTQGKKLTTFTRLQSIIFFAYIALPKLMKVPETNNDILETSGIIYLSLTRNFTDLPVNVTQRTGLRLLSAESAAFFNALVHGTIREREQKGIVRPDVLQLLMQARHAKLAMDKEDAAEAEDLGGSARKLSDEDITAQPVIFFFGGFETVTSVMCLATIVLSHHPDVQRRLQTEVDEVMERTDGKPSYDDIQNMKYLNAVISELFRIYPPNATTDRVCQSDTGLPATSTSKAITITKGTILLLPIIGLHMDSQYWDELEKFDPERFNDENKHKIKPYTYVPFGVGPRICVGQRFALIEIKAALVHLLSAFDLHPSAKTEYPVRFEASLNLIARGGFWCGISPRES